MSALEAITPPETRDRLRTLSFVLLALALVVTGYLSYTKLTNTTMVCVESGVFNCDAVSSSIYAYFPRGTGIPVAVLGFSTWIVMGAILIFENRISFLRDYGSLLLLAISIFGFLFHCYLTYSSIVFIQALCPWCLTAHTLMTIMMITQGIRVYKSFAT